MIGKYILPWFGGAPAVWSTVLLFFQSLLTGGYAYAYWLLGRRQRRWQGTVHLIVLAVSIGLLVLTAVSWPSPLTPDASWRPQGSDLPIWDILKILAVAVGIPYLLLASNSTLVQGWFSDDHPGRTPYRLYALSNVCLLYTSDAADERSSVDLGGRRIIKKKRQQKKGVSQVYRRSNQQKQTNSSGGMHEEK